MPGQEDRSFILKKRKEFYKSLPWWKRILIRLDLETIEYPDALLYSKADLPRDSSRSRYVVKPTLLTEEHLVTAMCLWEIALGMKETHPNIFAQGVVEARHKLIPLVTKCVEEWKEIEAEGTESIEENSPYDWGFCVRFLRRNIHNATDPITPRKVG